MNTFVQNTLNKVLNTENKRNIAKNSLWLFFDYGMRAIFGLLIGVWVARYLGPSDYGKLSYVIATISLLSPLYLMGLDVTIPKELIHREKEKEEILGATFFLKLAGSIVIFILAPIAAVLLNPGDKIILVLAVLAGLSYIFKSFETINIWFLNKLQSKYTVIARNTGLITSGILRIALILGGFSLIYFGLAITLETFVIAVVLGYIFVRKEPFFDFKKIRFDFKKALKLLNASWIFLLLGFFNTIMLNIDKIMLEKMTGIYEVGLYSAIAWLSFSFIILADYITTSTYPVLIKLDKDKAFEHYAADFQKFLNYMALLAYAIIIAIVLSSDFVVQALWGSEYKASAYLLSIQIFSILPYFTGLIVSRWVIINNYIKFHALIYFCGALINILLNYCLIKRFGIVGVPCGTIITYFWINIIAYYFNPKTKHLASMQLKAIFMLQFFHRIFKKY